MNSRHQCSHPEDIDCPPQIVDERRQAELGPHLVEPLHQESSLVHPLFDAAEGVLDAFAATVENIRPGLEARCNAVAEIGESVPSITDIALRHKQDVRDAIADLLQTDAAASDIAWSATLALDGAIVNAQLGGSSTEAALLGLQNLPHALA